MDKLKTFIKKILRYGKYKYKPGKVYHFGNLNHDVTFYVIRRDSYTGLLSYFITHIGCLYYALQKGYVPIIDMQNYRNSIARDEGFKKDNPWNWYFNQPSKYSLDEVYKSKNVVFSPIDGLAGLYPHAGMDYFTNKSMQRFFNKLFSVYIGFSESVQNSIDIMYDECLKGKIQDRIVGVLLRGTDYNAITAADHPVQPTAEEAIEKVKEIMKSYNCKYVYLTTEDKSIFTKFQNVFGENLLYNKGIHFYEYKDGKRIVDASFKRENDNYLRGEEYICQLAMLTKCQCFLAGRTSGSGSVLVWQPEYEYTYFWNKGSYGIDDAFDEELLNRDLK